jgi:primosomal protein N' (replication factor Y)
LGFEIIDSFKIEVSILVGTQMLAKGLDFDNVSLVGIMNADMLYHPDFRAFERSFQMMTQVAGRSGRSEKQGKVIIQTYNPDHNTTASY